MIARHTAARQALPFGVIATHTAARQALASGVIATHTAGLRAVNAGPAGRASGGPLEWYSWRSPALRLALMQI
jgi:hypothetical protein